MANMRKLSNKKKKQYRQNKLKRKCHMKKDEYLKMLQSTEYSEYLDKQIKDFTITNIRVLDRNDPHVKRKLFAEVEIVFPDPLFSFKDLPKEIPIIKENFEIMVSRKMRERIDVPENERINVMIDKAATEALFMGQCKKLHNLLT